MSPCDIGSTWVGYANCGTPYFVCRDIPENYEQVKAEMRWIRPRGGDLVKLTGVRVQKAIEELKAWPRDNPVVHNSNGLVRIAPHWRNS